MDSKVYKINNETKVIYRSQKITFINNITIVNTAATNATVNLYKDEMANDEETIRANRIAIIPEDRILEPGEMIIRKDIVLNTNYQITVTSNTTADIDINIF